MNLKTVITFVAVCLGVLLGVGGMLWQFGQSSGTKTIPNIEGERRYAKGSGEIVITEFSDFQCPGCAAAQPRLKEIQTKYADKITFIYRHFPLTSIHKNALVSAYAAEAAHKQGKFWEMHDKLFEAQREWATLTDPKIKFEEYAREIGLDVEKFKNDSNSEEVKKVVTKDLAAATQFGLPGTPSVFVNGVETEIEQLETKIEGTN